MDEIIKALFDYGIGVVCVAYMIYFQNTTMKEMLRTLGTINERLTLIEEKLDTKKKKSGD